MPSSIPRNAMYSSTVAVAETSSLVICERQHCVISTPSVRLSNIAASSTSYVISLLVLLQYLDFEEPIDPSSKSFFSEIISSISDVKFSHDGRFFLTRDYLTVKVCQTGFCLSLTSFLRYLCPTIHVFMRFGGCRAQIWDLKMEKKPVQTFKVHEHLRPKLCDVYENDCIFDKFQATWSGDDRYVRLHTCSS